MHEFGCKFGVIIVPMDRYDCLALSAICVAVGLHLGGQQEVYAVTAAAVLLQWVKMLYYLQPFPETGKCRACLRCHSLMMYTRYFVEHGHR